MAVLLASVRSSSRARVPEGLRDGLSAKKGSTYDVDKTMKYAGMESPITEGDLKIRTPSQAMADPTRIMGLIRIY